MKLERIFVCLVVPFGQNSKVWLCWPAYCHTLGTDSCSRLFSNRLTGNTAVISIQSTPIICIGLVIRMFMKEN